MSGLYRSESGGGGQNQTFSALKHDDIQSFLQPQTGTAGDPSSQDGKELKMSKFSRCESGQGGQNQPFSVLKHDDIQASLATTNRDRQRLATPRREGRQNIQILQISV